jgi:hypothetical protein
VGGCELRMASQLDSQYQLGPCIGKGSFGDVFKG